MAALSDTSAVSSSPAKSRNGERGRRLLGEGKAHGLKAHTEQRSPGGVGGVLDDSRRLLMDLGVRPVGPDGAFRVRSVALAGGANLSGTGGLPIVVTNTGMVPPRSAPRGIASVGEDRAAVGPMAHFAELASAVIPFRDFRRTTTPPDPAASVDGTTADNGGDASNTTRPPAAPRRLAAILLPDGTSHRV